ncbi:MAG: LPS export ABC transporter periplasmic protein LptC [Sphingobacteriaceae bacterium]|nr:LPS export ABC transporter periplasmic protein LptC [Sphingobacteriaceae bacterium]
MKFIILATTICFFSCQNKRSDIMALAMPKVSPTQQGKGITMIYTDSSRLKMVLKAGKMLTYDKNVKEPFTLLPEGLIMGFYNKDEKQEATLSANYGIHYPQRKRMEVKYNVVVVNKNGETLNTEHLIWDEVTKKIHSDAFVKITTGKEIIMGKGFESNEDLTQYQIKEVTGTIQLGNDEL